MSADLLRRAADKIRETAQAATPAPWWANPIASEAEVDVYSGTGSGDDIAVADNAYRADAEHIATWTPDVAELVAAWLDWAAKGWDNTRAMTDIPESQLVISNGPALALARRILGDAP